MSKILCIKISNNNIITILCLAIFCTLYNITLSYASAESFSISKTEPVSIEANEMYYDKNRDLVSAIGDVSMIQGAQIITANEMLFYRDSNDIYAHGNVVILREDGSMFFADKAKLNRTSNIGVILNFKARMGAQGQLVSSLAEMENENVIKLQTFVYSPCNICGDTFVKDTPLWQMRAGEALLNKEEERVYYKNLILEVFGFPVAYSPYLVTPSPGAKRKTGFLMPAYKWNGDLGSMVRIPFYLNIAPNTDATIGTTITQNAGLVHDLEFRHLTRRGLYEFYNVSTYTKKVNKSGTFVPGKNAYRGFFKFKTEQDFSDFEYLPGQLFIKGAFMEDAPKTFGKKYKIDQSDILTTDAVYQNHQDDMFTYARSLYFQDLRNNANSKTTAKVLPNIYHSQKYKPIQGIDGGLTIHYTNLNRAQGLSYQRIIAETELKHKMVSDYGIIFINKIAMRGDIYQYNMEKVIVQSSYQSNIAPGNGYTSRFLPEYITEASYPLINRIGSSTIILSPMIQGVISPNLKKLKHIDNEDGQSPEISYSNLFAYNKFKGYDLVESGHRLNYGIKGNIHSQYFHNLGFMFGQSLRAKKDTNFNPMSGLDGYQSDYVSKLFIQPTRYWYIHNESRIDNKNPKLNRNELFGSYSDSNISASLLHFYIGHNLVDPLNPNKYRQEIIPSISYRFYKEWWIRGEFHRKIGKKRVDISTPMISSGLALYNNNECLETMFKITRDYTHLKDLRPSTTYKIDINVPVF